MALRRRYIATVLVSATLLTSTTLLRAQSSLIDVGSAAGSAGTNVQVPVYLESTGGAQPAGLQVDVAFDASVLTFVQSSTGSAATAAGKSATSNTLPSGNLRILVAGLNQNVIANGVVALLEFQVSAAAPIATTALVASNVVSSNPQAQTIDSSGGTGLVIIDGGIAVSSEIFFPQIADGGGFTTSFVLVNPGDTPATGLLELFNQDGTPLAYNMNGNLDSAFLVTIPANALVILESSNINQGAPPGWAQLTSTSPVGGSIVYAFATGEGSGISEAGINPASRASSFSLSVDTRNGFLSGVAVANPNPSTLSLVLTLYDSNGAQLDQQNRSLTGLSQFALLPEEIFTGLAPGSLSNFAGVITITATGGQMVGTTLRFNGSLTIFSSLPVI